MLPAAIAALLLVLAAWRIATSAGAARRMGALVLWLSVGPLALALLLSLVGPAIFLDRVLSPAVFPLALLFGWLAASHGPRWQALAVLLLIAGMAVSAVTLFPRMAKEDWFALTRRIADHARPGDEIWTYPNVVALPVRYAAAEQGLRLAVRQIPADYPALDFAGDHPLGTTAVVTASPAQLKALVDSSGKVPVIWLVTRMEKRFDPDGALPAALAGRRRLIALRSDGDVTIRAYGGFSGPAQSFGD